MRRIALISIAMSCGMAALAGTQQPANQQQAQAKAATAENEMTINSCHTQGAELIGLGGYTTTTQIRVLNKIPKEYAAQISGNKITKIVYGVAQSGLSDAKVVISDSETGANLVEKKGRNLRGWHEITLDTPYEISGDKDLYIGYEGTMQVKASSVGTTEGSPAYSSIHRKDNGAWIQTPWKDEFGAAAIYAIATGDKKFTSTDLELTAVELPGMMKAGKESYVYFQIKNNGFGNVGEIRCHTAFSGEESKNQIIEREFAPGATILPVPTTPPAVNDGQTESRQFEASVETTTLADTNNSNNAASGSTQVWQGIGLDTEVNVLVEEFTTNWCHNCPEGLATMMQAIEETGHTDAVNIIALHSGYYTDEFTMPYTETLVKRMFGGPNAYFAPAVMVNRIYDEEFSKDNFSGGSYGPAVSNNATHIKKLILKGMNEPCFASAKIQAEGDKKANTVDITVSGKVTSEAADPTLHIVITEDSLVSWQDGATGDWYNNHTARICPTGVEGVTITPDAEGNYTYTTTVEIPKTITTPAPDNLERATNPAMWDIVAFVTKGNALNDVKDCEVYNSTVAKRPLKDFVGIADTAQDCISIYAANGELRIDGCFDQAQLFTTSGMLVKDIRSNENIVSLQNMPNGIYLVKVAGGQEVKTQKIIVNQ